MQYGPCRCEVGSPSKWKYLCCVDYQNMLSLLIWCFLYDVFFNLCVELEVIQTSTTLSVIRCINELTQKSESSCFCYVICELFRIYVNNRHVVSISIIPWTDVLSVLVLLNSLCAWFADWHVWWRAISANERKSHNAITVMGGACCHHWVLQMV